MKPLDREDVLMGQRQADHPYTGFIFIFQLIFNFFLLYVFFIFFSRYHYGHMDTRATYMLLIIILGKCLAK